MTSILVATDLTARSRSAIRVAAEIHAARGGDLTMLHVAEPPPHGELHAVVPFGPDRDTAVEELHARSLARLEVVRTRFFGHAASVHTRVQVGAPANVIEFVADAEKPDLIVMGTRGVDRLAHVLYGGVSDEVVRCGRHNVLLVPQCISEAPLAQRLLLLHEPGQDLERAVTAAQLTGRRDAEIHVLAMVGDHPTVHPTRETIAARLSSTARRAVTSVHVVAASDSPQAVTAHAARIDADIVVRTGTTASRLEELVFGGPADMVRGTADLPLLFVAPDPEDATTFQALLDHDHTHRTSYPPESCR